MEETLKELKNNIDLLNNSKKVDIYYIWGGNVFDHFSGGFIKLEKSNLTIDHLFSLPGQGGGFGKIWREKIYSASYKNLIILPINGFSLSVDMKDNEEYLKLVSNTLENIYAYGVPMSGLIMASGYGHYNGFLDRGNIGTVAPKANSEYREFN